VIGNAVHVMRIATGEIEEEIEGESLAAASLGRMGGKARAAGLTAEGRKRSPRKRRALDGERALFALQKNSLC
jgi:hypothetical protein